MMKIKISFKNFTLSAELNQTKTAQKIFSALPIESRVKRWGDEIYFEIPVEASLESGARAEVEVGELGYWPEGNSFCIFFGPTPASTNQKPRAYSEVNIVGKLLTVPTEKLREVNPGTKVKIEQE